MFILRIFVFALLLLFIDRRSSSAVSFTRRSRSLSFIYPGTKWCGLGNEAKDDGDLGTKVETDKCCRAHDHCKQYIPAHGSIGGTRNDSPYTISHCDCDSEFYHCLKKANTETAKKVGNIFFNVLQVPCFISQKGKSCRKEKCKDERKAVLQSPKKF